MLHSPPPIFVKEDLLREDDGSDDDVVTDKSMEELQRQLEDMDPEEFGKLWS